VPKLTKTQAKRLCNDLKSKAGKLYMAGIIRPAEYDKAKAMAENGLKRIANTPGAFKY